jgi:hypothetical protein
MAAVRDATSAGDLADRLAAAGVDVGLDPIQLARDNRERLRHALIRLQQIGLAWALANCLPSPESWESRVDGYLDNLSSHIETIAFTRIWSENDILAFLRKLTTDEESAGFWTFVAAASSLDDLISRLGLSNEELLTAGSKLEVQREDARRRKKLVVVCGKEFDGSDDNLSQLWSHICSTLPAEAVRELEPVDLKQLSSLERSSGRATHMHKRQDPTNKPKHVYISKSMENLIGLSGEIHSFRMLQNAYGSSIVSPSSWLSENSLSVYPDNKVSDGIGCDFRIGLHGRTYYIDVKSSEGDGDSFKMGSSEIRLALELTKRSRRRNKESYFILRVPNALTVKPSFQLLPNPYDEKFRSLFTIEEADARISYRLKQ